VTNAAILAASALLLFAYLLDHLGHRFRLPSVVLLIVTGLVARHALDRMGIVFDGVDPIVPIVGTLGLILIVLEGALDLEVSADRTRTIVKAGVSAVIGVVLCALAFAALFHFVLGYAPYLSALAAIPFAVISSAVAIPSATGFADAPREFVIYESSLSDIVGVLVFFAALVSKGNPSAFALELFGGGALSVVVALAASLGLYAIVNKAEGHVRFLPMLAGLVCLYAIGKALYLSPLVFVLVAGLVIGNPHLLDRWPRLKRLHSPDYDRTVREFKGIVAELTFATKALFFLLLGYWTDVSALLEPLAWGVAAAGVGFVFVSRRLLLRALRVDDAASLTWIAPRGLITVLLFLTAAETGALRTFPFGALMLTVLATASLVALAHHDRDERKDALAASAVDASRPTGARAASTGTTDVPPPA